jgi:hypothetical protein
MTTLGTSESRTSVTKTARLLSRATAPARVLPTFVVIGSAKAGTTALARYLQSHPDVLWSSRLEVHYFDASFDRSTNWYRAWFPLRSQVRRHERATGRPVAVGEKSPSYLVSPGADQRLHALLPDARLVVALRDPVERAFSHWRMKHSDGSEPLSFEDAVRSEPERLAATGGSVAGRRRMEGMDGSYLLRGRYADHLERWLALFPQEQLFVYRSEDLAAEPARWGAQICAHIGVDPAHFDVDALPRANVGVPATLDPAVREQLATHFTDDDARLLELTGVSYFHGSRA